MKRGKRSTMAYRRPRRQQMPFPATADETCRTVRLTDKGREYVAQMRERDAAGRYISRASVAS